MKVVCVKKRPHDKLFKIGGVYNMVKVLSHFPYKISTLSGEYLTILCGLDFRLFFIPIEEHREKQLDELLNG